MSLDNSLQVNRQVLTGDMFEDQEEVNEEGLFFHDQRDLVNLISDKDSSKYDLEYLMEQVAHSGPNFWASVLKELIRVFYLNTLKFHLDYELTDEQIYNIKELLKFLKIKLTDKIKYDLEELPEDRLELEQYLSDLFAPYFMIFSIRTISKEDLFYFKKYFDF